MSFLNGYISDSWDGDKLKFDQLWGYHFLSNGTLQRGITGYSADYYNDFDVDYFSLGDDAWTWDGSNNIVNLRKDTATQKRHRTWEVISVDEIGRALVLEYEFSGFDYNNDGEVSNDEIALYIRPRINILMEEDLSRWADAWANTQRLGLGVSSNENIDNKSQIKANNSLLK